MPVTLRYLDPGIGPGSCTAPSAGTVVAAVTGDIDEPAAYRFATEIRTAVDATPQTLIVDLTGVDFLGLAGAQLLAVEQMYAEGRDVVMLLVPGGRAVVRPLLVTGLLDHFECHRTVEEAVEARRSELAAHTGLEWPVTNPPRTRGGPDRG
ncbi:STAS domain-containing protein [Rhodococcus sp. NPDC003318]|uniref:STAS domain-containing protein n=1 Tax=Rhodococcus sp. NPDC003318 TaxID=3364503 RepID=UPI003684AE99